MANSKDRVNSHASTNQTIDLIDATSFAYQQNIPLTRFITINLKGLESRPQQFITAFLKLSGDWMRTKGAARAHVYMLEHPPGSPLNVHIAHHVPPDLMGAFAKKERRWMKQAGLVWKPGRLQSERIADPRNKAKGYQSAGELLVNTENVLAYMLKGAGPTACDILRIDHVSQGGIKGKRCGVAESISKAARDANGYRPPCNTREAVMFRWRCLLSGEYIPPERSWRWR